MALIIEQNRMDSADDSKHNLFYFFEWWMNEWSEASRNALNNHIVHSSLWADSRWYQVTLSSLKKKKKVMSCMMQISTIILCYSFSNLFSFCWNSIFILSVISRDYRELFIRWEFINWVKISAYPHSHSCLHSNINTVCLEL
jgi:hypothetical protein